MDQTSQNAPTIKQPAEVANAIRLIYAGVAVGIINTIADFTYLASLASTKLLIFQMTFTYAIIILLAFKISLGRNWARIIFLIVFLFGLPAAVPSLISHFSRSPSAGWLMLLTILLQMTATVLLFLKPSNSWFKHFKVSHVDPQDEA